MDINVKTLSVRVSAIKFFRVWFMYVASDDRLHDRSVVTGPNRS